MIVCYPLKFCTVRYYPSGLLGTGPSCMTILCFAFFPIFTSFIEDAQADWFNVICTDLKCPMFKECLQKMFSLKTFDSMIKCVDEYHFALADKRSKEFLIQFFVDFVKSYCVSNDLTCEDNVAFCKQRC